MKQFFADWGFFLAAALFLFAAGLRLVTGGGLDLTLFALGIAFLVIAVTTAKRGREPE